MFMPQRWEFIYNPTEIITYILIQTFWLIVIHLKAIKKIELPSRCNMWHTSKSLLVLILQMQCLIFFKKITWQQIFNRWIMGPLWKWWIPVDTIIWCGKSGRINSGIFDPSRDAINPNSIPVSKSKLHSWIVWYGRISISIRDPNTPNTKLIFFHLVVGTIPSIKVSNNLCFPALKEI